MNYPETYGLFKNSAQKEQFINDGYCVIKIQNKSIIDEITEVYQELHIDTQNYALYASNRYGNYEGNVKIHEIIKDIFIEEIDRHFIDYRFLIGHFIEKIANSKIGFQLHQDWNVTDEQKYLSAHVWIPHQDTSKENGGMYVIPKSHKFFSNFRSGSLDIPRIEINWWLKKIIQPINLKKGEMLVFHPALFHGSFVNATHQPRVATLINIMQKESPIMYYHLSGKHIEEYHITQRALMADIDMFIQHQIPEDSQFIRNLNSDFINNTAINSKILLWKYLKCRF